MGMLEDFHAGKPLNAQIARIMQGEEDEAPEQQVQHVRNYADGTPITNVDREHLRRLLTSPGWEVLLKLLDTALLHQEDAARKISKNPSTPTEQIAGMWKQLAADAQSRLNIVAIVEAEVERLKEAKKKKCDSGTTKTQAATN